MSLISEFREFAVKGNVLDLAVGVIIGAAFGKIVTSLVEDVVMPPISLVMGKVDFKDKFIVLATADGKAIPTSLADAKAAGVPVLAYGNFLNQIVQFLIVAFAVFILVKAINRARLHAEAPTPAPAPEPPVKTCPFCLSEVPLKATKCRACTADLAAA